LGILRLIAENLLGFRSGIGVEVVLSNRSATYAMRQRFDKAHTGGDKAAHFRLWLYSDRTRLLNSRKVPKKLLAHPQCFPDKVWL